MAKKKAKQLNTIVSVTVANNTEYFYLPKLDRKIALAKYCELKKTKLADLPARPKVRQEKVIPDGYKSTHNE